MSEINKKISSERREFEAGTLDESNVPVAPMTLFNTWMREALDKMAMEPYAFNLATASKEGIPSSRTVYMRSIEENGIVFFTNYKGKKGKDISENPVVCANFFWAQLERQVRMIGKASKINTEQSDAYFASRPRESQLGAWASHQSEELENHQELSDRLDFYTKKFENQEVPRPPHWGGYLIQSNYFEFWQGREKRLHDRITFSFENENWKINRINP